MADKKLWAATTLDPQTHSELEQRAEQEDRSVAYILRQLIKQYLRTPAKSSLPPTNGGQKQPTPSA